MNNNPENLQENKNEEFENNTENEIETNVESENTEKTENQEEDILPKEKKIRQNIKNLLPSISATQYRITIIIFALVSVLAATFRVFVITESVRFPGFTGETQWYKLENNLHTKSFLILYVSFIVAAFIISVFSHGIDFSTRKRSTSFVFVSSLTGFCMVGCAGFFAYRTALSDDNFDKMFFAVIILMLFTGSFFAMDSVGFVSQKVKPWFATIVSVFAVVRVISEFLRLHDRQYYSSTEYHLVSLVFLLLFFINNAKFHIFEKAGIWYRFFGLVAAFSLIVYSLPEIYISLFEPYYFDEFFVFCLVDITLAFYILTKLMSVKTSKKLPLNTKE